MSIVNKTNMNLIGGGYCVCSKNSSHIVFFDKNKTFNILKNNNSAISNDLAISQCASEDFRDASYNIKSKPQQFDNNLIPNIYGGGALLKNSLAACIKNKRENGYLYINQYSFWFPLYAAIRQQSGGTVLQYAFKDISEGVCG